MFSLLIKIAQVIAKEVDNDLYSPAMIKNQLMKLEQLLREGKISEQEFDQLESELLDRLE